MSFPLQPAAAAAAAAAAASQLHTQPPPPIATMKGTNTKRQSPLHPTTQYRQSVKATTPKESKQAIQMEAPSPSFLIFFVAQVVHVQRDPTPTHTQQGGGNTRGGVVGVGHGQGLDGPRSPVGRAALQSLRWGTRAGQTWSHHRWRTPPRWCSPRLLLSRNKRRTRQQVR